MLHKIYSLLIGVCFAIIVARIIYPVLIKLSKKLNYTDAPGKRKLHKTPVPVVGGVGIFVVIALSMLLPEIRAYFSTHLSVAISLALLAITGMIDDKLALPAKLKLLVQLLCAFLVADSGIRLTSLQGFVGIGTIPLTAQYIFTMIVVTGVTNAFNLVDGIDGLAGSLGIINIGILAAAAILLKQIDLAVLLLVVWGTLAVFLKFNWRPAKMFMGDSGSLLLGFLMSVAGISLIDVQGSAAAFSGIHYELPVILFAAFAVPVLDALRVFLGRMQKGKSPFSPDKTHLHHKFIRLFLMHNAATRKIITLHILIICSAFLLHRWFSISQIAILIVIIIALHSAFLSFVQSFSIWYRKIRQYENS